jgi:hypothetical protein
MIYVFLGKYVATTVDSTGRLVSRIVNNKSTGASIVIPFKAY